MRYPLLLTCSLVILGPIHAQHSDSLPYPQWKEPIKKALADTLRVDVLLDSAKAWVSMGETERPVRATTEAIAVLDGVRGEERSSLPIRVRRMQAYKVQGVAHHYAGRYAKALESFQHFQTAAEALGDLKNKAAALNYQGYQYRAMTETQRAKAITLQAIGILETLPLDGQLANARSGLGTIYFELAMFDSAMVFQQSAAELHRQLGNNELEAMCRLDIAELHMVGGRYDAALSELQRARPVLMEDPNMTQHCIFLVQEGRALIGLARIAEARLSLGQALVLSEKMDNDEHTTRVNEMLALVAAAEGRFPEALARQDSVRNALVRDLDLEKARELTEVRLGAEHEKDQALAELRITEERQQKRNALVGGGLVLLIAFLLLWLLLSARRNSTLLRKKNEEIILAHQRALEAEKQRENEEVRTRIARDIHDDIGSGLTKIAMLSNDARRRVQESSTDLQATLDRIVGHSREVSAALSDIVWSVDPTHDTSMELVYHARNVAQRLFDGSNVEHSLRIEHKDPAHPVAPGVKHHIVMVMKEAINNALKYADAKLITVRLEAGAHAFTLEVTDDGKGFDTRAMARTGNGQRNMQARADSIGATLSVKSSPGQGCSVSLTGSLE